MDWTKAKTILIVALLMTNIFLVGMYVIVNANDGPTEEKLQAETIALLKAKNIYVKNDLPEGQQKIPVLTVEHSQISDEYIKSKIAGQIPSDPGEWTEKGAQETAERFLKDSGLWSANVIPGGIERNGKEFIISYKNEYEGILLEESYMKCIVKEGKITEIERFWFKPVAFGKSKKATISASAALIVLMRSKEEREAIVVDSIEMVYWLDTSEYRGESAVSDTALPAWKVTYNGGKVKYIPAYND